MWYAWFVPVIKTALRAWTHVAVFDAIALTTASVVGAIAPTTVSVVASAIGPLPHIMAAPFTGLGIAVTPWMGDPVPIDRADISLVSDACHVAAALALLSVVWRFGDDLMRRYSVRYRRSRLLYDATRRSRYPQVDPLPIEWFFGMIANGIALLYSALPIGRQFVAHELNHAWCVVAFLFAERALRCVACDRVEWRDRKWMRNYTLYRDYALFVNPQMCRGRWSPFWDTVQNRNPFASRVPYIGSCPLPLVDFFLVDYTPEETLVAHARLRYRRALASISATPPTDLWTQALWRCVRHPTETARQLARLPPLSARDAPAAPAFGRVLRQLRHHWACRRRRRRPDAVDRASGFQTLPSAIVAYAFAHLDFRDHLRMRSCSHAMRYLSETSAASCPRMEVDFGARDHTAGPLPFVTRTHIQPQRLRVRNVGAHVSSLGFVAAGRLPASLRELHLDSVARGRYSFDWLTRLTRLETLRVEYATSLVSGPDDVDADRTLDVAVRSSAWRPVGAAATQLALRHLDGFEDDAELVSALRAPSVLARSLVHLTASFAHLRRPDVDASGVAAAPDYRHFSSLDSLRANVADEDGSLAPLGTFPALQRLQLVGYRLDAGNLVHFGAALRDTQLLHLVLTDVRDCWHDRPNDVLQRIAADAPQLRTLAIATGRNVSRCCFTHRLAALQPCRSLERLEIDERSSADGYGDGREKKRLHQSAVAGLPASVRVLALTARHAWAYGDTGLVEFASDSAIAEVALFCRSATDDPTRLDEWRAGVLFQNLHALASVRGLARAPRTSTTVATIDERFSVGSI